MRLVFSILLSFLVIPLIYSQERHDLNYVKVQKENVVEMEFRSGIVATISTSSQVYRGVINEIKVDSIVINGVILALSDITSIQEGARRGLISAGLFGLGTCLIAGDVMLIQDDSNSLVEGQLLKFGAASIVGAITTLPKKKYRVKNGYTLVVEPKSSISMPDMTTTVPANSWLQDSTVLVLSFRSRGKDFVRLFRSGEYLDLTTKNGKSISGAITHFSEEEFALNGVRVSFQNIKKLRKVYHDNVLNLLTVAGGATFIYGGADMISARNEETFAEGVNTVIESTAILFAGSAAMLSGLALSHRSRSINMESSDPNFRVLPVNQIGELMNDTIRLVQ